MKRLKLFVEGQGDAIAVPRLVKRLLTESNAWGTVQLDPSPFRMGGIHQFTGAKSAEWTKKLQAALKQRDTAGILLVLDGESSQKVETRKFCAVEVGRMLVDRARTVGAGSTFSLACVFACQEYESWLLAAVASLAGKRLPLDRLGVRLDATPPLGDLEQAPRDAKGALSRLMDGGYNGPRDQGDLTDLIDLDLIRKRNLRSFQRLQHAVQQLLAAVASGVHVATPP